MEDFKPNRFAPLAVFAGAVGIMLGLQFAANAHSDYKFRQTHLIQSCAEYYAKAEDHNRAVREVGSNGILVTEPYLDLLNRQTDRLEEASKRLNCGYKHIRP